MVDRPARASIVKPGAECAGSKTRVVNWYPGVSRQNVIGGERILRCAGCSVERIDAEAIGRWAWAWLGDGDLYWSNHRIRGRNERRAIGCRRPRIIEIDRRQPANPV